MVDDDVGFHAVGPQSVDMGGDIEAGRLRRLLPQVGDVHDVGARRGEGLVDRRHSGHREHRGEQ